jgi:gamma-glutamyltranspeptidase / glutathione hydrolase
MLNERQFAAARGASGWPRLPAVAGEAMIATSHPLAARAGMRALEAGGNAVDAALAAAAMLTVCEPPHNGIGGDAFAQLWWDGALHGLNGSGRAPAVLDGPTVDSGGPRSVTVPGAVRAWADLAERFARRGLDAALADAIDAATDGVVATVRIAEHWRRASRAPWPAPRPGERYTLPGLAGTLRAIAARGPDALYEGPVGEAIAQATWLSADDLAAHRSEWVQPIRRAYRDVEVCELPPNSQGVTALVALGVAEGLDGALHEDIEAAKVALDWAAHAIGDAPVQLPDVDALRARIRPDAAIDARVWPSGDTTFLCAVDGDRNAIALIQSLFEGFGSGVVAGDTGIALHSRGAGFTEEEGHVNQLAGGRRPFHTLMPGMLLRDGALLGPFGVMGASMQAQAHFQVVRRVVDDGLDPQAALDAARFRAIGGRRVLLEPGLAGELGDLRARGHDAVVADMPHAFGVGQMILAHEGALVAGSDGRADGHAAGL